MSTALDLGPWLMLAALLLLVLEIAVRRLVLPAGWPARLLQRLAGLPGVSALRRRLSTRAARGDYEEMSRLIERRRREAETQRKGLEFWFGGRARR